MSFKINHHFEGLLQQIGNDPKKERTLPAQTKQALADYKELRRQSELPADKRPLRRQLMTNEEKANYIGQHGQEKYLALPY